MHPLKSNVPTPNLDVLVHFSPDHVIESNVVLANDLLL
jgi:hypothetical protein